MLIIAILVRGHCNNISQIFINAMWCKGHVSRGRVFFPDGIYLQICTCCYEHISFSYIFLCLQSVRRFLKMTAPKVLLRVRFCFGVGQLLYLHCSAEKRLITQTYTQTYFYAPLQDNFDVVDERWWVLAWFSRSKKQTTTLMWLYADNRQTLRYYGLLIRLLQWLTSTDYA